MEQDDTFEFRRDRNKATELRCGGPHGGQIHLKVVPILVFGGHQLGKELESVDLILGSIVGREVIMDLRSTFHRLDDIKDVGGDMLKKEGDGKTIIFGVDVTHS
jgi:hypothetical protein